MRRVLLALLALLAGTGCSFHGPMAVSPDDTVDAGPGTVAPDAPVAIAMPDAMPTPSVAPCATMDSAGLIACYEFEDNFTADGTLVDSSPNHLDGTIHGLATATRATSDQAAQVMPNDSTYVPQLSVLDRPNGFTLAMWVKPSSLPAEGSVMGLLDHEQQYAMDIGRSDDSVTMRCILTGLSEYEWVDGITANTWTMFACTWDGVELCAYRWSSPSNHDANCFEPGEAVSATGSHGLAIGTLSSNGSPTFPLAGDLDSIHIYNHALTEEGLCTDLGQSDGCM